MAKIDLKPSDFDSSYIIDMFDKDFNSMYDDVEALKLTVPGSDIIRSNVETKSAGSHTISFSSTMGSLNYTLFITIEQDGFQTYNGHMIPTSATGFDITIPAGGDATITYTAIKFT